MRGIICSVVIAALCACGDDTTTTITCGEGIEGTLTATGSVEVTTDAGKDLRGAAIGAGPSTTLPSLPVSIKCAS